MKKTVWLLLISALLLMLFAGCGTRDEGPVKTIALPENGIVEKAELEKANKNGSVLFISGKQEETEYQWAVFGTKINSPRDVNFSAEITENGEWEYTVQLAESMEFSPSFSFRIPRRVNVESAAVYDGSGALANEASVSPYAEYTDVCFYVKPDTAEFRVVLERSEDVTAAGTAVLPAENKSEENAQNWPDEGTEAGSESGSTADYLSPVASGEELKSATGRTKASDGRQTGQNRYLTDPIPEGKPLPVEPEDQEVSSATCTCTFSISCATILDNMDLCDPEKVELVPANGWILRPTTVTFNQGESVFDVLKRLCREKGIHMEFEWTPIYNSAYIEGIHNLYEFDVGNLSGWMYQVNGWYPNYGCSRYALQDGDSVAWCYTCDLGYDVGGGYAVGG